MKSLTDRQREVLDFIAHFVKKNSYPPTVREIGEDFDISLRAVQDHLSALQKKGYISLSQKRSRSIRIIKGKQSAFLAGVDKSLASAVPVLGSLSAGKPLMSEENFAGYVYLGDPFIKKGRTYFVLRVSDGSMEKEGIFDGDLAVVEVTEATKDGQIVVVSLGNTLVLRRFFREATRVRLQCAGDDMQPVYCQDVRVFGTLASIIRNY